MTPKKDEFWVVENTDRGERLVVKVGEWLGRPCWWQPGDEEYCPWEWYRPIRKVVLGRASAAKKTAENLSAPLGASAQNGR